MATPHIQPLKRQSQPKQISLPPDLLQKVHLPPTEVWATLTPIQQSHLLRQLTNICRGLIKPSNPEESKHESS